LPTLFEELKSEMKSTANFWGILVEKYLSAPAMSSNAKEENNLSTILSGGRSSAPGIGVVGLGCAHPAITKSDAIIKTIFLALFDFISKNSSVNDNDKSNPIKTLRPAFQL
ncbi:MAG TPA: hypothetical protein PLK80_10390, partial [bacterium]|nr:hypothetical protein [bacterium]